jgi:hypothetical protein
MDYTYCVNLAFQVFFATNRMVGFDKRDEEDSWFLFYRSLSCRVKTNAVTGIQSRADFFGPQNITKFDTITTWLCCRH